jgi:hypothetical protein
MLEALPDGKKSDRLAGNEDHCFMRENKHTYYRTLSLAAFLPGFACSGYAHIAPSRLEINPGILPIDIYTSPQSFDIFGFLFYTEYNKKHLITESLLLEISLLCID